MSTLVQKLLVLTRHNLWWTWHPEVRLVFRDLDLDLHLRSRENPLVFLRQIDPEKLERRALDIDAHARIDRALRHYHQDMNTARKWGTIHCSALGGRPVAYFCMEFGLHESIPIYSGGLGILAGDHLKAAAGLGVPMVALGLLYHQGYTAQQLNREYWQEDIVEPVDIGDLPLGPARAPDGSTVRVAVELPGRTCYAKVLETWVGTVRLLLLDTRDESNTEHDRGLTARLYGGDQRVRIEQELLLGVGGTRALRALGITPSVFHLNEGHSAFAILERARRRVQEDGLAAPDAIEAAGMATVFTTHTPVEAGHDRFPADLAAEHLYPLAEGLKMPLEDVLGLGRVDARDHGSPFLPTVLALKTARRTNGVAALHGVVSRRMWHVLYPDRTNEEVPIGHITNGVHTLTWLAPEMDQLYKTHLGVHWAEHTAKPETWYPIYEVDDAEIWDLKRVLKARLDRVVGERVNRMLDRLGLPKSPALPLDPDVLTIGFARRFVPYKRADLIFRDPDRLAAILNDPKRPVNILFAGRAHPADHPGKQIIQRVAKYMEDPRFANRIVFVENYNMHIGRILYQGVDAWLNNPRRPLEACGTSGMKAVMNGGLHASILDGWWAEAWDGHNGFAIGNGETHVRDDVQDARDAESLYRVLEQEIVPLYYDRDDDGVPKRWVHRVKRSIATLAWRFSADRMVKDYVYQAYLPASVGSSCRMPP
ncbi:MAG: alpha-glucan family phosphorylase [Polyangiales bacterium]